ncbi:MAG: amidohydrolase family protein [Armatimonadetes bacterium]|nr:amidohydrolase family protein [Armatimonadota bacterium]
MSVAPLYFDSNAWVGPRGAIDPLEKWRVADVVDELQHCGIHGALVTHNMARSYDCAFGNRRLLEEIADQPRLFGCAVLLPHHAGEMDPPRRLVGQLRARGFVAARLCPKQHRYRLSERTCGDLLRALEGERLPLLLDADQASWGEVEWLCGAFPKLPVLLQRAVWGQERDVYPLLAAFDNLHLEFSAFQANAAIERIVARFGAERCLLGTDVPVKSPGAARAFVDYSRLDAAARALVAGGNLARLLGVAPPPLPEAVGDDPILARVKQGLPMEGVRVIDAHAHLVHDGGEGVGTLPMPEGDIARMLAIYDTFGCERTCLSSWLQISADTEVGNGITAHAVERHRERVTGYVSIDPTYVTDVAGAARRWHAVPGMLGLKPYFPSMRVPYDDARFRPWWEFANEHSLFALLHPSGADYPRQVGALAEAYPNVSFLLAHGAGTWEAARRSAAIARGRPNVFAEITYTPVPLGTIEYLVRELGADRVIFGTDAPMRDPRPQFGWLCYARLSGEEKALILGRNMLGILERVQL